MLKKEAEMILQYEDLRLKFSDVKAKVIPVIIGATGTISKTYRKYVNNIPGKHETKELQKSSRFGHCTHTSKSTSVKVQNISRAKNITCITNYRYGTAASLYTL